MIVLDTNVYVDALGNASRTDAIGRFVQSAALKLAVSSVVVAELLTGLRAPTRKADLLAELLGPTGTRRLLTPTHDDWERAGDVLRTLGGDAVTTRRSFWNDLLIAASCARTGTRLVTSNADDFRRIARVIAVDAVAAPWEGR